ncbi:unnamed protein product [Adineta steineri]|uniref:Histidine-specific methyltransferase SAM-dependent domain-containing protein n=1 Tax=Adineta steineri TaxID=433720 RepID=A0A815ACI2_9BILA|nr:unnamed protein product [Adineta steineri]CAF4069147.1 unnamed protein product [Adineta steineri]
MMSVAEEIFLGLSGRPKSLSNLQWLHYDDEGSFIFEKIGLQDEYYVARAEHRIFELFSNDIIDKAAGNEKNHLRIVELGSGTAKKTSILLQAALKYQGGPINYLPIDVSSIALDEAQLSLKHLAPDVCIMPQLKNYATDDYILPSFDGCTLVMYIGISIGNSSDEEAKNILHHVYDQLKVGDALLLSIDACHDPTVLLSAYNDKNGVVGNFQLNVLRRLNREFGYNFDLDQFRYQPVWNEHTSRVEQHLQSLCSQQVKCIDQSGEKTVHLDKDDMINMIDSHKFSIEEITMLLNNAGFIIEYIWNDEHKWINIILARKLSLTS